MHENVKIELDRRIEWIWSQSVGEKGEELSDRKIE